MKKFFNKLLKNCDLFKGKMNGFTLAEVLITLGIIGIVAAITVPTLMKKISTRQLEIATNNFNRKFGEALKIMNNQGVLADRKTTQGFLNEFGKIFKIVKICDNTNLSQCFPKNIKLGDGEIIDTSTLKTAKSIVSKEFDGNNWNTDVMGVQFPNGVSSLIAYNQNCQQNQYKNVIEISSGNSIKFTTNNCIAMIYDVNSFKKPNVQEIDIKRTSNVKDLSACAMKTRDGSCISKTAFDPEPISYQECMSIKDSLGIKKCCESCDANGGDRYASAAKACGGVENIATLDDISKILGDIYGNPDVNVHQNMSQDIYHTTNGIDMDKWAQYGLSTTNDGGWDSFLVQETCEDECLSLGRKDRVYRVTFWYYTGRSNFWYTPKYTDYLRVFCVKH